jgi:hypothetical protein
MQIFGPLILASALLVLCGEAFVLRGRRTPWGTNTDKLWGAKPKIEVKSDPPGHHSACNDCAGVLDSAARQSASASLTEVVLKPHVAQEEASTANALEGGGKEAAEERQERKDEADAVVQSEVTFKTQGEDDDVQTSGPFGSAELGAIVLRYDKDGDRKVSFVEWTEGESYSKEVRKALHAAFSRADSDADGLLNLPEIARLFEELGNLVSLPQSDHEL